MAALMFLLDRFHRFLLATLVAETRAKVKLEREVIARSAAQRKMQEEIEERRRLEREIAGIGDEERRWLGHELHDGVCQQITAALLRCQAMERRLERSDPLSKESVLELSSFLSEAIEEAHNLAVGLGPLEPNPDALARALRSMTDGMRDTSALRCEFRRTGDVRTPDPAIARHPYRIAQEALSNAVRPTPTPGGSSSSLTAAGVR